MSEENKYVTEAGTFMAKVKMPGNGWFGESGKKKTPFIRIPLLITDGPQKGREIVWKGYITQGAVAGTVKRLAKAFGWDGDLNKLTHGHDDEDDNVFLNKACQVVVEEEEYEGKTYFRARWLNAIENDAGLPKDRVADLISSLNSLSKAAASEAQEEEDAPERKPKAKAKKVDEKYEGRTHSDEGDEIPF